jgi:Spy/CpxP family protein refolding chaperone
MVGIIVGTVCLIGLVKVTRGHHRWGHHHHHHHGHRHHGRHPRDRFARLADALDLSGAQRDQVEAEVRAFVKKARSMRGERDASREDLAKAVRGEALDEVTLGEMFARHDDRLRELRMELVERLAKIHAALDDRQRQLLADRIEEGLGFGGPFRRGW